MDMPDLGKQVGPLPLGAWVAVVGGSLAYMMYSRSRGSSAPVEVAAGPDPGVGMGGVGAVGAYTATNGGINAPASATASIDTNQAWGQQAFNWLVGNGSDGATVDTAIRNYLDGISLTTQQQGLISQALSKFGQTPESLGAAPDAPPASSVAAGFYQGGDGIYQVYADGSADWLTGAEYQALGAPQTTQLAQNSPIWNQLHLIGNTNPWADQSGWYQPARPAPAPAPAPVTAPQPAPAAPPPAPAPAPAPARTYSVRPGDSLSLIASRYWEPWITWQSIYNANRGIIGGNPGLIRPGQVLTIA